MRILHIISTTDPKYGGPVESVAQLGQYLRKKGVFAEVVACQDSPDFKRPTAYPLPVHALGPALGDYGYTPRLVPWLETQGRSYDCWIINGIWQYHAAAAARVAKRIGKKYLVYTHGMLDPWSRRAHPAKYLKKFVYWSVFEQHTLRRAAAVCFTAEEESALAHRYFPFGRWHDFVVGAGVEYPPDLDGGAIGRLRSRFPSLDGKKVWLFLSRLHPKKALDVLLHSFARVAGDNPNVHLLIVGPGDVRYVQRLVALSRELGIESQTTFTGPLYGEDKWCAYRLAELFLLPSHQENFGIVVAEALALGIPVCISDKVNIWREVQESGAGLICRDTVDDLTRCLKRWHDMSPEEKKSMRKRARESFAAHFHVSCAADRLFSKLQQLVNAST
jgi:glycosyltransferase involved in cell wall biosynthesis